MYDPSMPTTNGESQEIAPSIDVKSLNYAFPDGSSGLVNVILNLPPSSRTLLIGGEYKIIKLHSSPYTWP